MTPRVREILSWYGGESPALQSRLAQLLNQGVLGGSGKIILATAAEGLNHGPAEAFGYNPDAFDPSFFFRVAGQNKLSAVVAPLGAYTAWARDFVGEFPYWVHLNHYMTLSSWQDTVSQVDWQGIEYIGASGVMLTLPLGNSSIAELFAPFEQILSEARKRHLLVAVQIKRAVLEEDEVYRNSLPINELGVACHFLAQAGVHVISLPKVDPPSSQHRDFYSNQQIRVSSLQDRIRHLSEASFYGQRIVIGQAQRDQDQTTTLQELQEACSGGLMGIDLGPQLPAMNLPSTNELVSESVRILKGTDE